MRKVFAWCLPLLRRFRSNCEGTTAIEFGFVFPMALLLMMAIFQISMVFVASQNLENATADLGRYVRTGQAQSGGGGGLGRDAFRQMICDKLIFFLECDAGNFQVDVQTFPDFGSISLDPPLDEDGNFIGPPAYDLGSAGEIVLVRTFYKFPVWLPMIGPKLANIGKDKLLLASASAFRNEPF